MSRRERPPSLAAANAEAIRIRRLREDAERPLGVNLAETIALSHKRRLVAAETEFVLVGG